MSEKKLFLLDGMALIYRAFYAFIKSHRYNSKGLNTSAMFGFTNTLLEVLQKEEPTHIAVVFDTSAPTERHIIFPEYKAQRDAMPEDLSKSIPYIFKIIEAFRIPIITKDGFEADDIIGTLALKASEKGYKVYMMTPDKDFAQLVRDNVFIYKPARMGNGATIMGTEDVLKKWEIEDPLQVIDILGLWGDSADNIPGVPSIGEKTAKKLIKEFKSVEGILENTDKLKGSQKKKFIEFREQALLSKKLATIIIDAPVEFNEDSFVLESPDKEKISNVFKELEFRTLLNRVLGESQSSQANQQVDLFSSLSNTQAEPEIKSIFSRFNPEKQKYKLINSTQELTELIKNLESVEEFSFDTETNGLSPIESTIIGMSFSFKKNEAYYIDLGSENKKEFLGILKPILESNKLKTAQNLKFDMMILDKDGIKVAPPYFDTMLAHFLIEPDKRHNMDEISRNYLRYEPLPIEDLIGRKGKNQLTMDTLSAEDVKDYASEDADITFQIKEALAPIIKKENLTEIYEKVELPLISVLAQMEQNGVFVDKEFLENYSKELAEEIEREEKSIYDHAGERFNISSPKQLGVILFDKLKLDEKPKKTKTGQYQTNEEVLTKLKGRHEIIDAILEYRELIKLKSTYVDALPELISPITGRIHTSFNQAVAGTGRLSSNNPNLQNIPVRTERGRKIRQAFIASSDDFTIISADYSQIELRIIASISEDEHMMEAFRENRDIHRATAARVFGVEYDEVTKDMRSKAKTVNFGIIYGISAFGLSERIGISRTEAKEIIDEYFDKFPGIKKYMDDTIEFANKNKYVQTLMGRKRKIFDIDSRNKMIRGGAERLAINAPIQGTAADMIKLAMISIQDELNARKLKTKMIIQVHDELIFETHKDEVEIVKSIIKDKMVNALPLNVPVLVDIGMGDNWLDAH